ncbi:RES family NAD+ phosphorylase [Shouchella clausii]|uniref:RES family NAD+ phosphorylase n=1 Tax=Shouchella clausii TaxID=79880 RepID=UPI00270F4C82|nr:RES family NAD+ phosphorylase [Shouchella clausii]MDO7266244.1 RES family NAD+ phosphorylase [Shouchella clausii]MDO7286841.1 RES family NAD+ phosphorylase [Shouchella clausii]
MICCEECFKDEEIRAIIKGLQVKGDCQVCSNTDGYVYDTDKNKELSSNFDEILDVYTSVKNLPDNFPKEKLSMIKDELHDNWNIFNVDKEKVYMLLKSICHDKFFETPELFDYPVGISELVNEEYLLENSLLKTFQWLDFVNEIKSNIRFHTNIINTNVLSKLCKSSITYFKKGDLFYRARIATKDGFGINEMGPPPNEKATNGRANPAGISCLYLADGTKTAIHEIKAALYDYVNIGTFQLKEDIAVVDFSGLDKISPFILKYLELKDYIINKDHLRKIGADIGKPLRRNDSSLDYLPTQYIVDFIKSEEHIGIKYNSTVYKKGYNLAIFKSDLFECKEVQLVEVKKVSYEY